MNTLDRDRLKEIVQFLQLADQVGFSSLSSPIDLLEEVQIDLALLLSSLLKEGNKGRTPNKEIRFDEIHRDALNNPKQISFGKPAKLFWNPQAAAFYKAVALFSVELKISNDFEKAFAAFQKQMSSFVPPVKLTWSVQQKQTIRNSRKSKPKVWKNKHYYRRQRNKWKT